MGFELIGEPEHQADEFARLRVDDVLGDRTNRNAVCGEFENRSLLVHKVAEPSRDRVNEHGVDRPGAIEAVCQHLLKLRPLHRAGTLSSVAIGAEDRPSLALAVVAHLSFLLLERKAVFSLPVGRDADVEDHPVGPDQGFLKWGASAANHLRVLWGLCVVV
ncbi:MULTISPECIES: hypothetical protein [Hyphomicrobiales]|uniref:hypothetical protein n=1 Tax=Methylobacterium sp. CCH7-A2 TaxID=1768789 RepID=UPI00082A96B7|nr:MULTISPECIES: hypothetical protein [Hyphomicrobiales]